MKVEQLIREKISSLSAGQKKVAEYILQHLDSFSYSTLAKLSKEIPIVQCVICCSCGNGKNVILYSSLHLGKTFKSQRISEAYDSGFAYGNFLAEFRKGGITERIKVL